VTYPALQCLFFGCALNLLFSDHTTFQRSNKEIPIICEPSSYLTQQSICASYASISPRASQNERCKQMAVELHYERQRESKRDEFETAVNKNTKLLPSMTRTSSSARFILHKQLWNFTVDTNLAATLCCSHQDSIPQLHDQWPTKPP
jgi:hypothetical protein